MTTNLCPHCGAEPKKGTWLIGYELSCGTFFYNKDCIDQDDECRIGELEQANKHLIEIIETHKLLLKAFTQGVRR